ncbi:MAG: prepilin-type N-terminal cleavage/methylation domain-containing protein [Planctomycetes bacterium]|nr:prepilin-type N-terminal cleavage/methylation domain-containing protein [Planctomycetota bacterium]
MAAAGRKARRPRQAGLTLVEVLVAVGILAFLTTEFLYLRTAAVERAGRCAREALIQRLGQEKLDEIIFGEEEGMAGTFEDRGHPDWTWEVKEQVQQIGDEIIVERTLTVTIRPEGIRAAADESKVQTVELSSWSFPDERWYELNAYLFDEEGNYVPPTDWMP